MSKETCVGASSVQDADATVKDCHCDPCAVPAFCRNAYYRGKLLTERDFADEQQYHRDRMRLHTRALHGWGVVCGLKVKPHPHCPERMLVVDDGFAIDRCGREIRVLKEAMIELPKAPEHDEHPHPRIEMSAEEFVPEPDCVPGPHAIDLYLCISYAECETEFSPAPFDDCGCLGGSKPRPNRICEGGKLELFHEKPDFWDEAVGRDCEAADCCDLYGHPWEPCRRTHGSCCVPLAKIEDFVPGHKLTQEHIKMERHRRRLASTETLDKVLKCVLDKLPCGDFTQICDTNWQHGQSYHCHQFMSDFIAEHHHHKGFTIRFTKNVHAHTINSQNFQAIIVFHPEDASQSRLMEIAPAEIHTKSGETEWCTLSINKHYANNKLEGKSFDLYIALKCDFITDINGVAVDGNFVKANFNTGDGAPGGTFESWIKVRHRHRGETD